jgi:hypothetical protein
VALIFFADKLRKPKAGTKVLERTHATARPCPNGVNERHKGLIYYLRHSAARCKMRVDQQALEWISRSGTYSFPFNSCPWCLGYCTHRTMAVTFPLTPCRPTQIGPAWFLVRKSSGPLKSVLSLDAPVTAYIFSIARSGNSCS